MASTRNCSERSAESEELFLHIRKARRDKYGDGTNSLNLEECETSLVDKCEHSPSNGKPHQAPTLFTPRRYWKNLLVISLGFMFEFSAYKAISNLQSTLNYDSGLGVASLCACYIGIMLSCLTAPLVVKAFTLKWSLVVCSAFYPLYYAGSIYPTFYTLIPSAFLMGLAASPFWTAVKTYITTSAFQYTDVAGGSAEHAINRFQGIFFCLYQSSQVWGNLVSSLVLTDNTSPARNASLCGRHSCGTGINFAATNSDAKLVERGELILISIFVALGLLATATFIIFLDHLPKASLSKEKSWRDDATTHLTSTLRLLNQPRLLLIVPLFVSRGVHDAFLGADFTQSFVSCTQGAGDVGFVMIIHGVVSSLSAVISGQIERYVGRIPLILCGGALQMTVLFILLFWSPDNVERWQLAWLTATWGVSDGIFLTQIVSLIGILFPSAQEPAFANYMLWEALGYALGYAFTIPTLVCISHKLYGLIIVQAFAILCYLADEYLITRTNRSNNK